MKFWQMNIVTEDEVDSMVSKLLNELHQLYRLRKTAPGQQDYTRKEQAVFTQLRLLSEVFPASRKTRIRAKLSFDRWSRVETGSRTGIQVNYEATEASPG